MSWELCTSGQAIAKAGANANVNIIGLSGVTIIGKFYDEAAASVNTISRRDWLALSGATTANFKAVIADLISDIVAMKIINYDMSGYTSRLEAQTMLDVIRDNVMRNIDSIKDDKNKEKML
jgi:hypothetical protein